VVRQWRPAKSEGKSAFGGLGCLEDNYFASHSDFRFFNEHLKISTTLDMTKNT